MSVYRTKVFPGDKFVFGIWEYEVYSEGNKLYFRCIKPLRDVEKGNPLRILKDGTTEIGTGWTHIRAKSSNFKSLYEKLSS